MADGANATIASALYRQLRTDILEGRLLPGAKLRIEAVRQRYSAGASPLREALNRLSAEGLVQQNDQRGFSVAPMSPDELRELVQTRCWVEELALRQSMAAADPAWEEGLLVSLHRLSRAPRYGEGGGPNPDWESLHRQFHADLISRCGSRQLLRFCGELRDGADRYRNVAAATFRGRTVENEHRAIVDAVLARDPDAATGLLVSHYRRTLDVIEAHGAGNEADKGGTT